MASKSLQLILLTTFALVLTPLVIYRVRAILNPGRSKPFRNGTQNERKRSHLLVVLGSGGHTAEMMAMLERAVNEKDPIRRLDWRSYANRTWVVGAEDRISAQRAQEFEEMALRTAVRNSDVKNAEHVGAGSSIVMAVPRAREIHQSALTAPLSCFRCMVASCIVLLQLGNPERDLPDIILCNGPATATILVFTSILLRFFDVKSCNSRGKMRTIYVESWARVKRLSLSGRILCRLVDRFLVQWPQLETTVGPRAEYMGVIV